MPFLRAFKHWALALSLSMASLGTNAGPTYLYSVTPSACNTLAVTGCDATGRWYFVQGLPEPDDLVLAVGALLAAGLVTWRRRRPEL